MITLKDLGGLKLVGEENFSEKVEALGAIENAITQGSQAWGVSPSVGAILYIARDLRNALELAEGAQENHRALKGKQLELGRSKSMVDKLKEKLDNLTS